MALADEMEGVEATGGAQQIAQPLLTEQETRILEVYERLEELQLEIALLKAQGILSTGVLFDMCPAKNNRSSAVPNQVW